MLGTAYYNYVADRLTTRKRTRKIGQDQEQRMAGNMWKYQDSLCRETSVWKADVL
jgi:hypothetical protein